MLFTNYFDQIVDKVNKIRRIELYIEVIDLKGYSLTDGYFSGLFEFISFIYLFIDENLKLVSPFRKLITKFTITNTIK